jgi:hypothetical protein
MVVAHNILDSGAGCVPRPVSTFTHNLSGKRPAVCRGLCLKWMEKVFLEENVLGEETSICICELQKSEWG